MENKETNIEEDKKSVVNQKRIDCMEEDCEKSATELIVMDFENISICFNFCEEHLREFRKLSHLQVPNYMVKEILKKSVEEAIEIINLRNQTIEDYEKSIKKLVDGIEELAEGIEKQNTKIKSQAERIKELEDEKKALDELDDIDDNEEINNSESELMEEFKE